MIRDKDGLNNITVVVPVKNELANIGRCLDRLRDFPEVVVVDSGSTDGTKELAAEYDNVTVVDFRWNGKYPKKRNWILENYQFNREWVLFVDADECLTDAFKTELATTLDKTDCNGFWLNFNNYFMDRKLRFGDKFRKIALVRLGRGKYEYTAEDYWSKLDMEVHEPLAVSGNVGELKARIEHHDFKGLKAYIDRHNDYSSWEVGQYYSLHNSPEIWHKVYLRRRVKYYLIRRWYFAPLHFLYTYILRLGFLDGLPGLIFACLKFQYYSQIYFKMLEYDRNMKRAGEESRMGK